MSKRPGDELIEEKDPLKKQKLAADLPSTSSSTANKISYGSLKSTAPSSSSSSAISYAALRKQQVSTLKAPAQSSISYASMSLLQAQTKAAMSSSIAKTAEPQRSTDPKQNPQQAQSSSQNGQGGNGSKEMSTAGQSQAAPSSQGSNQSAQNPTNVSSANKQETSSQPSVPGFSDASANPLPKTAGQLNLKSQQLQILERAKKQKEEEQRLRQLKQQQAKKVLDGSGQLSFAQQQLQQQQQLLKAKEALKAKEKKPLTKYELEMEKLKKYAQKKEEEKKKIEKIYQMAREGKIVIEEHKRPFEEEVKMDSKEIDVRLDDKNNLVDSKGNVVVVEQKKTLLKVNQQKKQEEKLRKMMRNARVQNAQIFMDQNLFMTTSVKRDRKKVHALNFIEDTNKQEKKEEDSMQIEQEDEGKNKSQEKSQDPTKDGDMEEEESGSSGSDGEEEIEKNEDFKQLIQKTEVDYKREEFQKTSNRYLQLLHKKKQSLKQKHHDPIPDIEWWDTPLFDSNRRYYLPLDQEQNEEQQTNQLQAVPQTNENNLTINILDNLEIVKHQLDRLQSSDFAYSQETYKKDKLSNLIEHPRPFKNEGLPNMNQVVVIPNYMTQQERQKLRRRHRLEKERERQDKVKLGLLPPPPPKVKLKNMMRVLGNEAVADPSKMEALVRHGIEERLQEHLRRNEERKLTKEQKAEKFLRKLKRDSAIECRVALFRIENLHDRVHKFKVDISAQQMQLHGLLINPVISAESRSDNTMPAIVLVEGGPKSIKFYKKLLLRRIKWTKNSYIPKDENGNPVPTLDLSQNKCALVWEGVVKDHSFNKWRVMETDNELEAKRAFSEKSVEFYFDMAINYQYPE